MKTEVRAPALSLALLVAVSASTSVAQTFTPYTNDTDTVLLEHFEGSTAGSAYAVYGASAPCGGQYPTSGYSVAYPASQSGLGNALQLCHPTGLTEPAYSVLSYPGELLSRANGTLELWLKASSYGTGGIGLVSQGPFFGACSGWTFGLSLSASGVLQAGAWNAFNFDSGTNTVPLNQWTHVAVSWGSTGAKLYINGQLVGTDLSTGAPATGFGGSFLGQFGTAETNTCTLIDELRISSIQRTTFNVTPTSPPTPAPSEGFWMYGGSLGAPQCDAAAGVINGQLYLAEGLVNGNPSVLNQAYTPSYFAWSQRPPGTIPRANAAAGALGGNLYVVGGCYQGNCAWVTNVTELYDPVRGTWTRKAPMPTARTRATAAAFGNRLYVFGGATGGTPSASSAVVEMYDPAADAWTPKSPMPTARENAMAAAIGDRIYVVGGYISSSGVRTNLLEVYNPASDSWTTGTPMPTARERAAVGAINGQLHIVGGENSAGPLTVHEVYYPATDTWSNAVPRQVSSSRLPSGQLNVGACLVVPSGYVTPAVETYLPNLAGPAYPPPGGVNLIASGDIGRSGGLTWTFSNAQLQNSTFAFWGVTNSGVKLSFNNPGFVYAGEIMSFQPAQSDLCSNLLVWTGMTGIPGSMTVYTRCLLSITTPSGTPCLVSATNLNLAANIGALYRLYPGATFQANIQFQAASSPGGPFSPALDFYDAAFKPYGGNMAFSSFAGGFMYADQPPIISTISNQVVQLNQATGPIAFTVGDLETPAAALGLSAVSDNTNLVPLSDIVFGGSGSARTVTITPLTNQAGTTTITITITNGLEQADTTFFFTVNLPPQLTVNQPLAVDAGGVAPIPNALLQATDVESGPSRLIYTINPDGNGSPPREGLLQLNGTNLVSGSTFTQQDLDEGRVVYVSTNRCATQDDFQFNVTDGDGGVAPTGQYTAYTFRININPVHLAFSANDTAIAVGLGGTYNGALSASNSNCPPVTMTYRLVADGAKGSATVNADGTFTYVAAAGQSGSDSFTFQVNDGVSDATAPGIVSVTIQQLPPVALVGSVTVLEGSSVAGQLSATDPNNPPPPLTYQLVANASKGTATITDPGTGAFSYTPNPGAMGTDSFTFTASDGTLTSAPANFMVVIRPTLDPNDIVVADSRASGIILVRPPAGEQFALSTNGLLQEPRALAVESSGHIIVLDAVRGLVRVDPLTGAQTQVTAGTNFSTSPVGPTSVAIDTNGLILVADGVNGVVRVNPTNGTVSSFASGGLVPLAQGVIVDLDSTLYVAAPGALAGGTSGIVTVDPLTAAQTPLASGSPFTLPLGQALGYDGKLYVTDVASFAQNPPDKLLAVDLADGSVSVLSTNALLNQPTGLGLSINGTLFIACNSSGTILEATTNGSLQVLSSGGLLQQPFGLTVVRQFPSLVGIEEAGAGTVRLTIRGERGSWATLEASSNLTDWAPLAVIPLSSPEVTYTDPDAVANSQRFYRLWRY